MDETLELDMEEVDTGPPKITHENYKNLKTEMSESAYSKKSMRRKKRLEK